MTFISNLHSVIEHKYKVSLGTCTMKYSDKIACSFPNWYNTFESFSFKSICIPVPNEVLKYLQSDTVTIPPEALPKKNLSGNIDNVSYSNWDSADEDGDEVESPSFPDFSKAVQEATNRLGGQVFVKLNWSAPTDAAWVATNSSLKCSNLQDIYLLLKCSDKISKDLSCKECKTFYVILKKWEDIHPGSEFRCFVLNGEFIAITQRDTSEFHKHILSSKYDIVNDVKDFFKTQLKGKFFLSNFIFDVVWQAGGRIKLVDLNRFNYEGCDPYLFSWQELNNMIYDEELSPEFRFIGEDIGIQPTQMSRHFGMPKDLTELSSTTSRSLIELLQTQINIQDKDE